MLWRVLLAGMLLSAAARADVTLLLEEPFGTFGGMTPTGHAAIYLSRICAETPVTLRRCAQGEPGVVISRYHRAGNYDWMATPVVPYFYAVDRVDQIPGEVTPQDVAVLRDQYRRRYLESIAPDQRDGSAPPGDWIQLIGAAYDRAIYAFGIQTDEDQDDAFIQAFNSGPNENHFKLLFHNCADFARQALNFYFPKIVHRSLSDVGIMTPKQAAKCLVRYSKRHPELHFAAFVIPQVAGTVPRSRPVRGVIEALFKSKRYILPLAPLALLHPLFGGTLVVAWVEEGHFNPRSVTDSSAFSTAPAVALRELESNQPVETSP
ncbi:MAG: hypothetical protein M3O20_08340 [Acidobacteriota bacterium]|nr:hypothetical protein [Acidobacteriota bacterium]